jgi:hypothetical protein
LTTPYSPLLENILSRLKDWRKSGTGGWSACCPAHHDRHPSLSIRLGKEGCILLKCHAGCTVEQILAVIGLTLADLFPATSTMSRHTSLRRQTLSLLDLAKDKLLPWKYLFNLGVAEDTSGGIKVPYHLPDGTPAPRYRIRTALVAKEGSWWNKGEGEIVPYGLERLEEARKAGYLVLTKGETDSWTLWFHKFCALGVPGAEMTRTLKQEYLAGFERLYLTQEPDPAGTSFVEHIVTLLSTWQWPGHAYAISLPNAKDPNDLHKQDWKAFPIAFQQALDKGRLVWSPPVRAVSDDIPPHDRLPLFTIEALLTERFPASHWVVRDLLPEGLNLLGGKPKQGKSRFALSTALTIADGGLALGAYQTAQGNVLYLALEDTERRLQERLKQLLDTSPSIPTGVEFALAWPRLDQGGLTQLEAYVQAHPGLRAIVIDTWAMIAPCAKGGSRTQYEGEYAVLTPLKRLADEYHIAILIIHHLRKTGAQDILDEIVGSTGMVGTVDTVLILKRERGQEQGSLFVTGRDIPQERTLPLRFDMATGRWRLDHTQEHDDEEQAEQQRPADASDSKHGRKHNER